MLTRLLPAGDLDRYLESDHDSRGRPREFPALKMRGCPTEVLPVLVAQAPRGVRPKSHQKQPQPTGPGKPAAPKRPASEWNRHCEQHLVHLISCYQEPRAEVERNLSDIILETEHLILAGLPADVLYFYWYEHPQTHGAHAHGGLLRTLLHSGRPYAPRLHPELRLGFDRLVSRHFGYSDPLDPSGHRVAYAAWGSAKPENAAEIQTVGELANRWWRSNPVGKNAHQEFLAHLGTQFRILAHPAADGAPQRAEPNAFPELRVPLRRDTVVVASRDERRAICFKGPACQFDFNPAVYAAQIAGQQHLVEALRQDGQAEYERFQKLLGDRVKLQRGWWVGPDSERITQSHFAWLEAKLANVQSRPAGPALEADEEFVALDPLMRWTERGFPFATDQEVAEVFRVNHRPVVELPDLADGETSPLRELIEEELEWETLRELEPETLAREQPAAEPRVATPAAATPVPLASRLDSWSNGPEPQPEPPLGWLRALVPRCRLPVENPPPARPAIPLRKHPAPSVAELPPPRAEELKRKRRRERLLEVEIAIRVAGECEGARFLPPPEPKQRV